MSPKLEPPDRFELSATPQQLFYHVKHDILATIGPGYLEYTSIPPAAGYQVVKSLGLDPQVERKSVRLLYNPEIRTLSITIPTALHNCHVSWAFQELSHALVVGFFTQIELVDLDFSSNTRFDNFPIPWQNIYKEPDCYIKPAGATLLTLVFEAGFSESYQRLIADKNLWLRGGAPVVNVVMLLMWSLISGNKVKGFIELWRSGAPNPRHVDIFPAPAPGPPHK
ncbi:hypothetical protein BDW59DRAFT_142950 [Aspergillus cavernicola]|uniref:Uncharacterized protein n=1 Tax=Aspergillus cavernicola TaxID=176166 RepID=A0ABR4IMB1_9EURO